MPGKGELIPKVLQLATKFGLTGITPVELNDGGNLSLHLSPHPVVARVSTVLSEENADFAYHILERELLVHRHLQSEGIPVVSPTDLADAGPHDIGGTWMTLWEYIPRAQFHIPAPGEAVELVSSLSAAMKNYTGELPVLGIWERTCQSAAKLGKHPDERVQALLAIFSGIDERMRSETGLLVPSHGDAHIGNLLPGPEGWVWIDFEDVSLMPEYWDLASFVCIPALFRGVQQPTFRYVLEHIESEKGLESFGFCLAARTLMSTLGNLDYALAGHGDLEFATRELEIAEDFIHQVHRITGSPEL